MSWSSYVYVVWAFYIDLIHLDLWAFKDFNVGLEYNFNSNQNLLKL
jgi:hypothetical protein